MDYRIYFENVPTCDACELAAMLSVEYGFDYDRCLVVLNDYSSYYYTFTVSDLTDFIENQQTGYDYCRTVLQSIIDSIRAGELPEAFLVRS